MKKKINLVVVLIIILAFSISIIATINNKEDIILIQLSPQSHTQMMGYILKTNNGKIIAIDGGLSCDKENFEKYINEYGGKVDYWFITHAHCDHAEVMVDAINDKKIEIGKIYISLNEENWYKENEPERFEFSKKLIDTLNKEEIKNKVVNPKLNEKFDIDGIKVEILGIRNPEITKKEGNAGNEQSMVFKLNTGKTTMLFLGDTGKNSSKKLLEYQKDKLKSNIVQMAHHGQNGATKELYQEIKPKICLWPTTQWLWNNDASEGERNRSMENI